jgi:hypothetical protein
MFWAEDSILIDMLPRAYTHFFYFLFISYRIIRIIPYA